MATVSKTVTAMVDNLYQKLISNQEPTAEEQALLTSAIAKLSDKTNLEKAIVAVAEEHINGAIESFKAAQTALVNTNNTLEQNSQNLELIPTMGGNLSAVATEMQKNVQATAEGIPKALTNPALNLGEAHYVLDYYDNTCAELNNKDQDYGAYNMISLVDYDNEAFYFYYDGGNQTNANNPAVFVSMGPDGIPEKTIFNTGLVNSAGLDSLALVALNSGDKATVKPMTFIASTKELSIHTDLAPSNQITQSLDYFKVYQDPQTKALYAVDSQILHIFAEGTWKKETSTQFSLEAHFESWAAEKGYIPIHDFAIKPSNTSNYNLSENKDARGGLTNYNYLYLTRPNTLIEVEFRDGQYFKIASVDQQTLARAQDRQLNGGDSVFCSNFRSKVRLPQHNTNISSVIDSQMAHNAYGDKYKQFPPQLIAYSPIHRCIVIYQHIDFFAATNKSEPINTSLSRIYFA